MCKYCNTKNVVYYSFEEEYPVNIGYCNKCHAHYWYDDGEWKSKRK